MYPGLLIGCGHSSISFDNQGKNFSYKMEERRTCLKGGIVIGKSDTCWFGHELAFSIKCPFKSCSYCTKAHGGLSCRSKKSMRRVCFLGHKIPAELLKCDIGHDLGKSLKCENAKCKFSTKPVVMTFMELAGKKMEDHMSASHPDATPNISHFEKQHVKLHPDSVILSSDEDTSDEFHVKRHFQMLKDILNREKLTNLFTSN